MQRPFAILMLLFASFLSVNAQVFTSRVDSSMEKIVGQPFTLGEVGAVIVDNGKEIKVLHAMPVDMRPKAYKDIDIKDGDIVLMCNGKRLKTVKELEEAYNVTAVAADFKLGVKRGEERMIVAFAKADPKDLPKMQMNISTTDGAMPGGGNVRRMVFGGGGQDIAPLMGLGIIVGKKDDVFKIVGVMQNTAKGADLKVDDIVESLNGVKITSSQQLSEMYEKIAVGAKLDIKYKRDGKSMQASLAKPEAPQGRVMMRSNQ
jgi:PDZ domain-containing secreted protein